MTRIYRSREYRFFIPNKAVSFRSPHAKAYKKKVRKIAKGIIIKPYTVSDSVEIRIDYFHKRKRKIDMDNVAKCIMDALNGIAYKDDKQVKKQSSVGYHLANNVDIVEGTVDIIKPLFKHSEYVFVRLRAIK